MIYMGPELQKKIIPLFHYALNRNGALFLGTSETVGEFGHLFAATDRKAKLYHRKDDVYGAIHPILGNVRSSAEGGDARHPPRKPSRDSKRPLRELTERVLLEEAPVAALINERGEVLFLHGRTGQYLEPAPGEMGVNILKMAREGLRHELTNALHQAASKKERVFRPGLRVKTNGEFSLVNLTVRPAPATVLADDPQLFLVIFEPALPAVAHKDGATSTGEGSNDAEARILALQQELRTKDEYLHAIQEEMQTSNEELKSSNEELQSTNEELQSTNEELETSKEELQSVNEELATVNTELQNRVADLSRVNNDMNNLLAGTGIGTVFVDHQLRIRRFTPAVAQFINLIPTDVGRPLGHIVSNLVGYDGLVADVQAVLDTLVPVEGEVHTRAGTSYRLHMLPYRTADNVVEGAVITFTELTAITVVRAAPREPDASSLD